MFERLKLKLERHPQEDVLMAAVAAANPQLTPVVTKARAAGLPWANIFQIIAKFGPQAITLIEAIITALFPADPAPATPDTPPAVPAVPK